jgi:hypothetical protein
LSDATVGALRDAFIVHDGEGLFGGDPAALLLLAQDLARTGLL